jgi:hypothetical protein
MVKRRRGFNATTNDWELFAVPFASESGPQSFALPGVQETSCFQRYQKVSSPKWDFICEHP